MNKSVNKNILRIIPVVILIIVAAVVSFFVLPKLYKMEGATTNIVMLKTSVEKGTRIEANMLVTTEVGAFGLDGGVIKDPTQLIGKYALQDVSSKDLLFAEKFSDVPVLGSATETGTYDVPLADDQMLLTLQLSSTAAGAAGNILPGDLVNVAVYQRQSIGGGAVGEIESMEDRVMFPTELQEMTVYRVQTAQLTGIDPECDPSASTVNERIPVYITLACTQAQADMLVDYSYSYTIHFLEVE